MPERGKPLVPLARLERARLAAIDFESIASTIPPQGHTQAGRGPLAGARRLIKRATHDWLSL